jgi:hypothetical protein
LLGCGIRARRGQPFRDLLQKAVLAFEPALEALQPAALLILPLDGLSIRGESRFGVADPADRLGCFRLPFCARPPAAVSLG